MRNYPETLKETLLSLILEVSESPELFVKDPSRDFTRDRKLTLESVVRLIISMGGNSIYKELLESRGYDVNTATTSAFVQQRDKILPCLFEYLLHEFTHAHTASMTYYGYRLFAIDGSSLHIPTNPDDLETYCQTRTDRSGFNLMHMTALFDLRNKLYTDACVQPLKGLNENSAFIDMLKRSRIQGRAIIIADRGFESYNNFANIEQKGWNYVIRCKDVTSCSGILAGLNLPKDGEFDIPIHRVLTRKNNNEVKNNPDLYKHIVSTSPFDFLDSHSNLYYPITLRVVRFMLPDGSYQAVITNLSQADFPPNELRELYKMRWGIETSFRELKYAVGLTNFHSKSRERIVQEVFARIIMYNFAEMITSRVVISNGDTKHTYQVNFTIAIHICRHFLRALSFAPHYDIEALISRNVLPIRPDRQGKRNIKTRSAVSFIYRVA